MPEASEESKKSGEIIRLARKKLQLNQKDFGKRIKRSQGVVSGYEKGRVVAPAALLIYCMNILETESASEDMKELIEKLKRFDKPEFANVRSTLSQLFDALMP